MFDALTHLVDGLGSDRQSGIDDAKSDAGKDTSLPFTGFTLPTGTCVNPVVGLPGIGGQWTVDICSYTAILATMFDALWFVAFAFAVMSLVSRATSKPVA
jgi:hypothetical protein